MLDTLNMEKKMTEKVVDIESKFANFGLTGGLPEDPIEEESLDEETESEELDDQVDASDEDDDDDYQDADDEQFEEDEETDDSVDSSNWKKKALAAEKQMKKYQSESDKLSSQNSKIQQDFQQLVNEFQSLKTDFKSNNNEDEDEFDLDIANDDDILTGSEIKEKLLGKKEQVQKKKYVKQLEDALQSTYSSKKNEEQVINAHPDWGKAVEFSKEINFSTDPELNKIQGNTAGLFYAIRSRMLESQVKDLRSKIKKSRGSVPPTSTKTTARREAKKKVNSFERMLNNSTLAKYGIDS